MSGGHEAAIGILDGDGMEGGSFVDDGGIDGAKVGGAASVGDGKGMVGDIWRGGRTYSTCGISAWSR